MINKTLDIINIICYWYIIDKYIFVLLNIFLFI